jgi:hypothetical protein
VAQTQIPTHEYQRALDEGILEPKLTVDNTKYWTDYLRVVCHPKSLLSIPGWEYDPVDYPLGRSVGAHTEQSFSSYAAGIDQWEDVNTDKEYLESHFRPVLEQCDMLQGINLAVDMDSGWGGFASKVLEELRDNYVPNATLFSWGYHKRGKQTHAESITRIQGMHNIIEHSSLYLPVTLPLDKDGMVPFGLDGQSDWHVGALHSLIFETVGVLSSLRDSKRITMATISDSLTRGTSRNIVSDISCAVGHSELLCYSSLFSGASSSFVFSKAGIERPAKFSVELASAKPPVGGLVDTSGRNPWDMIGGPQSQDLRNNKPEGSFFEHYFGKQQLISRGTDESALSEFECSQSVNTPSSFPTGIVSDSDNVYAGLAVTTAPRKFFKTLSEFASVWLKADEREDERDSLYRISEDYTWGYDSDSDVSD